MANKDLLTIWDMESVNTENQKEETRWKDLRAGSWVTFIMIQTQGRKVHGEDWWKMKENGDGYSKVSKLP